MYCASGALFSTIETVAGENPLAFATSLIVTARLLPLFRFTLGSLWPASSGNFASECNGGLIFALRYSGGISNESGSRNPFVFQIPNAIPAAIQIAPTTLACTLKFHHNNPQIAKPTKGTNK